MINWKEWYHFYKYRKIKGFTLNPPISPNSQHSKKSWILFSGFLRIVSWEREEERFLCCYLGTFRFLGSSWIFLGRRIDTVILLGQSSLFIFAIQALVRFVTSLFIFAFTFSELETLYLSIRVTLLSFISIQFVFGIWIQIIIFV